jgi:hypothetical protein
MKTLNELRDILYKVPRQGMRFKVLDKPNLPPRWNHKRDDMPATTLHGTGVVQVIVRTMFCLN